MCEDEPTPALHGARRSQTAPPCQTRPRWGQGFLFLQTRALDKALAHPPREEMGF